MSGHQVGERFDALVSMVIPTLNRSADLARLVTSLAGCAALELVVVDDCSDSAESARNRQACTSATRVQFARLDQRRGAPTARNVGAALAAGEYLWFFDDDDEVEPETVLKLLDRLSRESVDVALLTSDIFRGGTRLASYSPTPERDNFEAYRTRGQLVSLPCVVVRRRLFEMVGGWDEGLVAGQDTDFILRLSRVARLTCWTDLRVRINAGPGPRISNQVLRQQRAKCQFLRKNWRILSWRRRAYYVASLVLWIPLWKVLTGRAVALEILAGSTRRER